MRPSVWLSALFAIAVALLAPSVGSSHISLSAAFAGVSPDHEIFFYARLPRVILALLAGAALSVTGVLFQCMLAMSRWAQGPSPANSCRNRAA